ncbi:hypothetical protein KAZ66_00015 [Candidatus Woesebacteria bacterium]|nr:hypothetical protein [Candidatus Woesebacteria bacterium]
MERTIKCPICNEPYKFYSHSAADQSACHDCVAKAEAKMRKRNNTNTGDFRDFPRENQLEYFGKFYI